MSVPVHVFRQTLAALFAPVATALRDEGVSELLINRYDQIYVERRGCLHRTALRFPSEYSLMSALRNLSQFVGRELSAASPILEARLPDGSRVEAIIPPASPGGASVCIRRFRQEQLTLETLAEQGAVSPTTAELLESIVRNRRNVIVGGGSGAGKTSLLNAMVSAADDRERVIVIEDSKELQVGLPHVVHLEAQPPDSEGRGGVSVRQLLHATLRMRPDRIVIGEIRGGEALELIQAMTSGHRGCLSTLHGTLPSDTLSRLETMALMSDVDMPVAVLRMQVASAIDFLIQIARTAGGERRVTHIAEVTGFDQSLGYRIESILEPEDST